MSSKKRNIRYNFKAFHIVKMSIIHNLGDMENYASFIEGIIRNEKKELSNRYSKDTLGMSEDEKREYFDIYGDDAIIVETFSELSLNALIVTLFSCIESGLFHLCNAWRSDENRKRKRWHKKLVRITPHDMRYSGIDKAKKYFKSVAKIDINAGSDPWQEIICLRKVRNCIVHNDGKPNDALLKDGKFIKHIRDKKIACDIQSDKYFDQFKISTIYVEHAVKKSIEFFRDMPG